MNTHKKTATIVGVLFIIGTVAYSLSVVALDILEDPDYLVRVSENGNQIIVGTLLVLVAGLALAMVPVMMFPILKKHNEALALGYVVFRGGLETVTYMAMAISWLLTLALSQEYGKAGAPDASHFQTLGTLLPRTDDWIYPITAIVFSLGALMFNYLLYQSKLIPRWLSGWGFIGVTLDLAGVLLSLFGLVSPSSTISTIFYLPIALQEMVFAVWLIVKGFNPSAIASESAR